MNGPVLVIGATGTVGGALATRLEQLGHRVRAASRRPPNAGVQSLREFVEFDLERPETFGPALDGVDRVFLIARPGDDNPERLAVPLIDEMVRHRVRRLVDLSALGAETRDDFGLRRVERHIEASGIPWTHLRPNWFMQVFSGGPLLAGIRATGAIHLPAADARISYIDVGDLADVAAVALIAPGHEGRAYALTGGESLHHDEVAAAIAAAAGRPVRYGAIPEDAARAALAAAGLSAERVERLVGFYRRVREGACAPVSPDVASVLGRAPTRFIRFAAAHSTNWRV